MTLLLDLSIQPNEREEIVVAGALDTIVQILKCGNSAALFSLSQQQLAAKPAAGRKPPAVREAVTPKKVDKDKKATEVESVPAVEEREFPAVFEGARAPEVAPETPEAPLEERVAEVRLDDAEVGVDETAAKARQSKDGNPALGLNDLFA